MKINELYKALLQQGASAQNNQGEIKLKLPKQMDENIKQQLISRKDELKTFLETLFASASDTSVIPVVTRDKPAYPLSSNQKRLWFIDKLQGHSSEYNMTAAFNVSGELNAELVEQAINTIIDRHEILRTNYLERDGQVQQVLKQVQGLKLTYDDLSQLSEIQKTEQLSVILAQESDYTFDLENDLLLRVRYIHLATEQRVGVLVFNLHHIAADGWSIQVLTNEFKSIYQELISGEKTELPKLSLQYIDYAHWQNKQAEERHSAQVTYWKKQLADIPIVHNLPLDFTRPAVKQHQAQQVKTCLDSHICEKIESQAKALNISPFMFLHAILSLVVSTHSHSKDIVIGTPVANRFHRELEPMIGFFVNTLALRVSTDFSNLADYFNHIKQVHLDAVANQEVPFDQLVEQLSIPRDLAHAPIFQILFTVEGEPARPLPSQLLLADASLEPLEIGPGGSKFDLDINFSFIEKGLQLKWSYDKALFSEQYISGLNQHVCNLIEAICSLDIAQFTLHKHSDLPMLSSKERDHLLQTINANTQSYDQTASLVSGFERQVQLQPHKIALEVDEQKISYLELDQKANQLAHYLNNNYQIVQDTPIGICCHRSVEMLVAILAVLKSGGAYVPLDPNYPEARLKQIVTDANPAVILTMGDTGDTLTGECLDISKLDVSSYSRVSLAITHSPHQLAYVIYTSGSTGKPKGVAISHQNAVAMLSWAADTYNESDYHRVLASTSINFDLSVFELFVPLSFGGTCVLVDNALSLLTQSVSVSLINTVPSAIKTLIDLDGIPSNVKVVNLAGEPLPADTVNQLIQHGHCERVYNLYGPSEDTTYSTYTCFNDLISDQPSIGRVINNSQAYILADDLSLLPYGAVGELYLAGDGLARGYLNQPDLTSERFINNPYYDNTNLASSKRLYRTGDLVRYLKDGDLAFIGRVDDQIKIRGFRIELGEISHQLSLQSQIDTALVLAKDSPAGKYLQAYIKPVNQCEPSMQPKLVKETLTGLAKVLPDYMVPKQAIVVNEWPLTPNGKIDKQKLEQAQTDEFRDEYIPASSELESQLVTIWSKLLHIPEGEISTTANFFDLGGHSLLSVRLASEIRAQLSVEIAVKTLFITNTIQGQAKIVLDNQGQKLRKTITQVYRQNLEKGEPLILPLSYAQQRLWFLEQLNQPSAEYNMPAAFNVNGQLDLKIVQSVLNTIIARHEILRTVYRDGEHGGEQVIRNGVEFKLTNKDVSKLDLVNQQQAIYEEIQSVLELPFNLKEDLMIRASYITISDDNGILLFNMHHIASDGWSMQLLLKEFTQLYLAFIEGKGDPLSPLSIQYGDFAQWQREYSQGEVLTQQLVYWQQQLNDISPVHSLQLDYKRPEVKQHKGASVTSNLNAEVANKLNRLAKENGLTSFMLFHSALALLLSRYSHSQDIVIGTPVANRLQSEVEALIGFFVNTLVLRVDTSQQNLDEYFKHIKEVNLAAQSNQDVPFEQLVEQLQVPRSTAYTPLFQIMLTTHNDYGLNEDVKDSNFKLKDVELSPLDADSVVAKFDLDLNVMINEQGVSLEWTYDTSLFNHEHINSLNNHLCCLLESMANLDSDATAYTGLAALPMLSQQEQAHLLVELNQTQIDYDKNATIGQLFEYQALNKPNNIALSYQGKQITYEELNRAANRLAHCLIKDYQVKPDTLVGICSERSIEMVIAILAILKAGGAYVPLDPSYPKDRLSYMVKEAGLGLILSYGSGDLVARSVLQDGTVLELTGLMQQIEKGLEDNPVIRDLTSNNLAYVIYTSGSTGQPKGVMVHHQALVNYQCHIREGYGVTEDDKILQFSTISFDIFVEECFGALCQGAQLILRDEQCISSVAAFYEFCCQHNITVISLPTAFWQQLSANSQEFKIPTLKSIIVGGEALSPSIAKNFLQQVDGVSLFNSYGPTETTVTATTAKLISEADCEQVTIGKANANNYLLVLGQDLELQPFGAQGELYIGGDGVSKGYLNRDDLTDEHFIPNPYYDDQIVLSPKRLYRTGDLVRYTKNAELVFIGRNDEQIKLRGFRIELGEINRHLQSLSQVSDATVQVIEHDNNKLLVAYIKPEQGQEQSNLLSNIEQALASSLPDYMLPNSYNLIEEIPLTQNGKVDRKGLPQPQLLNQQVEYVTPTTETQTRLVEIWSELLALPQDKISISANFFSLGGHSLLLLKANTQIQHIFDIKLNVQAFFEHSSIKNLASHIDSQMMQQQLKQQFENINSDEIEKVEF